MLQQIKDLFAHMRYPSRQRQLRIDLERTDEELRKALASLERSQAEVSCYTKRKRRLERELSAYNKTGAVCEMHHHQRVAA